MGLLSLILSCVRFLCGAAPAPAVGVEDDTVFDASLFSVNGEALRAQAHAAGDAASATSAASRAAYAAGDGAKAKQLSLQAGAHRTECARHNAAAARAIFAQKNHMRGLWEIDLHLLLVAEAIERVKRRLASATAAAAAEASGGHDLIVIVGQGHHSVGGVAKLKPAVLDMLQREGWAPREDTPNPGCLTVHISGAAPRSRL